MAYRSILLHINAYYEYVLTNKLAQQLTILTLLPLYVDIHRYMYTLTTDDFHTQFDIMITISTIHIQFSVHKLQCSYMNRSMVCNLEICTGTYVMKAAKQ